MKVRVPRLWYGARYCNANLILEHGPLTGNASDSGRSDILSSAAWTPVANSRSLPTVEATSFPTKVTTTVQPLER